MLRGVYTLAVWLIAPALWSCTYAAEQYMTDRLLKPFAVRNMNPFQMVFGIPPMESPRIVARGKRAYEISFDVGSNFTSATDNQESIYIDGESYRLALRYTAGLDGQWEIGAEVPLVSHRGGFLDGLINEWHSFFDLPTLGRDLVKNDQLLYRYSNNNRNLVDVDSSVTGLGDVVLFAGKAISYTGPDALTLRGQIKLPTGDSDKLFGSGGIDAALSIMRSHHLSDKLSGSFRIGAAYLGSGDVLPDLQQRWAGFGGAFIGWQAFHKLSLKSQIDFNSPLYRNSTLGPLSDATVQLTIGATWRVSKTSFLDFSVTEDELNPNVSPDVVFTIRFRTSD